jgi:DNA-binding transcriptional regulator GbsR (MarR family)
MSAQLADELTTAELAGLDLSARHIYTVLRADGPMTRNEIARVAGVSLTTVWSAMRELKARDIAGERPAGGDTSAYREYYVTPP